MTNTVPIPTREPGRNIPSVHPFTPFLYILAISAHHSSKERTSTLRLNQVISLAVALHDVTMPLSLRVVQVYRPSALYLFPLLLA